MPWWRPLCRGHPQKVNRRGEWVSVVLSAAEYERLRQCEQAAAATLADHLLALPRDDEPFERLSLGLVLVRLASRGSLSPSTARQPKSAWDLHRHDGVLLPLQHRTAMALRRLGQPVSQDPIPIPSSGTGQPSPLRRQEGVGLSRGEGVDRDEAIKRSPSQTHLRRDWPR